VHNSVRSQIAEAILNSLAGDRFEAQNAGLSPGPLNPLAIAVMTEWGIDISTNQTKNVFELVKRGELFSCVITVCDATSAEKCPIFAGIMERIHWSFEDPSSFMGTSEEKLEKARKLRDTIRAKIEAWLQHLEGGVRTRDGSHSTPCPT
jgi:arsenate reductase (thioredoxin)